MFPEFSNRYIQRRLVELSSKLDTIVNDMELLMTNFDALTSALAELKVAVSDAAARVAAHNEQPAIDNATVDVEAAVSAIRSLDPAS
jgi:hypothetical protein